MNSLVRGSSVAILGRGNFLDEGLTVQVTEHRCQVSGVVEKKRDKISFEAGRTTETRHTWTAWTFEHDLMVSVGSWTFLSHVFWSGLPLPPSGSTPHFLPNQFSVVKNIHQVQFMPPAYSWVMSFNRVWSTHQGPHPSGRLSLLSQLLCIANTSPARCSQPLPVLWFCLAWADTGLRHRVTITLSSRVRLPWCVWRTLLWPPTTLTLLIIHVLPWYLSLGRSRLWYRRPIKDEDSAISYSLHYEQLWSLCWSLLTVNRSLDGAHWETCWSMSIMIKSSGVTLILYHWLFSIIKWHLKLW